MGTELLARGGAALGDSLVALNRTHPNRVRSVHRAYVAAGAQWITANSFLVHRETGDVASHVGEAVLLAREEAGDLPVALSLSFGAPSVALYGECARAARDAGAALVVLETFTVIAEAVAALRAAAPSGLPVAVLMVFDAEGQAIGDGTSAGEAARALCDAGAAAVGANCQPPDALRRAVAGMASAVGSLVPVITRPSAGIPVRIGEKWTYPWTPEPWAAATRSLQDEGATLLGGCCGAGPAHVATLAHILLGRNKTMRAFFYPTQAHNHHEWFGDLLAEWHRSNKKYLCFPFMSFKPHTLPSRGDFWMYMYYRQKQTDIDELKGKVKFRVHVIQWSDTPFAAPDIHLIDFGGGETVWFLCDKAEEVRKRDGNLLTLDDFSHRDGKQLYSTIRTSIAPVVCTEKSVQTIVIYPTQAS